MLQSHTRIRMRLQASIFVSLKPTVSDPEGLTIAGALNQLGFNNVRAVRSGKYFQLKLEAKNLNSAEKSVSDMCQQLLSNPVIEDYSFELSPEND